MVTSNRPGAEGVVKREPILASEAAQPVVAGAVESGASRGAEEGDEQVLVRPRATPANETTRVPMTSARTVKQKMKILRFTARQTLPLLIVKSGSLP